MHACFAKINYFFKKSLCIPLHRPNNNFLKIENVVNFAGFLPSSSERRWKFLFASLKTLILKNFCHWSISSSFYPSLDAGEIRVIVQCTIPGGNFTESSKIILKFNTNKSLFWKPSEDRNRKRKCPALEGFGSPYEYFFNASKIKTVLYSKRFFLHF